VVNGKRFPRLQRAATIVTSAVRFIPYGLFRRRLKAIRFFGRGYYWFPFFENDALIPNDFVNKKRASFVQLIFERIITWPAFPFASHALSFLFSIEVSDVNNPNQLISGGRSFQGFQGRADFERFVHVFTNDPASYDASDNRFGRVIPTARA